MNHLYLPMQISHTSPGKESRSTKETIQIFLTNVKILFWKEKKNQENKWKTVNMPDNYIIIKAAIFDIINNLDLICISYKWSCKPYI